MTIVLQDTDRIPVTIDDVTFWIRPLSWHQKMDIMSEDSVTKGDFKNGRQTTIKAIKYAIKNVSGLVTIDDEPYELKFDPDGLLTNECVDELLNLPFGSKVVTSCYAFVPGVPDAITDAKGNPIEGVKLGKPTSLKRMTKKIDDWKNSLGNTPKEQ